MHSLHQDEMTEMDMSYKHKIQLEKDRYEVLVSQKEKMQSDWDEQNKFLVESHEKYVEDVVNDYETKIEREQTLRGTLRKDRQTLLEDFAGAKDMHEEDARLEIQSLKTKYDARLRDERETTLRLKGENVLAKKRFSGLQSDIEDQRGEIAALKERERERFEQIKGLEKDIAGHKKEVREREETIRDKERRIRDLKKKNQELEKFKFVLDYKIKELRRQIEPRMNEIADMRRQIKEMDRELVQYKKSNAALGLMIGELKLKRGGMQRESDSQKGVIGANAAIIKRMRVDLHEAHAHSSGAEYDHKRLKKHVNALYKQYVQEKTFGGKGKAQGGGGAGAAGQKGGDSDMQKEYNRQREYLEKSVESLKQKPPRT
jgi:chromosome segregation ATPase